MPGQVNAGPRERAQLQPIKKHDDGLPLQTIYIFNTHAMIVGGIGVRLGVETCSRRIGGRKEGERPAVLYGGNPGSAGVSARVMERVHGWKVTLPLRERCRAIELRGRAVGLRWCRARAGLCTGLVSKRSPTRKTRRLCAIDEGRSGEPACYGTGSEVECVVPGQEAGQQEMDMKKEEAREEGGAVVAAKDGDFAPVKAVVDTLLLISPFFFWGTSMVAMKELGPHMTPMLVAAWRLLPAGVVLLVWAQATGSKGPSSPMGWLAVLLFGIVDGTMFQGFLAEGLQRTSAGLGSVIIDSQPLTVAVIASILYGESLGSLAVMGLLLGVGGLILLEVPYSAFSSLMDSAAGGEYSIMAQGTSLWDSGEWWMLLAAQSMAIGTVMVRWVSKYADPIAATGWHMILGGAPLLALALEQGEDLSGTFASLTTYDYGLLLYISLLGSAASYGVFFYEATVRGNLTALSSLTFLTPMFAAAGGYLVLGEVLDPLQLTGALVTILGVTCINWKGKQSSGAE